ncbi:MAG: BMP family ABC transporter substrate-binding protein [Chloroflexi bacterium]|nr:BMP family ABC transporter substrate-binding protein [Chloroflexota bacterium]MCC6893878.1 BMP family ABC transporter substrate-binding protein [Anaerolineae bacterium]
MSKRLWFIQAALLTATLSLTACSLTASPTTAPTAAVQSTTVPTVIPAADQPTTAPVTTAAVAQPTTVQPGNISIKVGLVTNVSGLNDQAFNQLAWAGIQKAATDMGFKVKFVESTQPTDYEKNIDALATEGYNVIITVGSLMGDATVLKAKQYPNIKFAIIDSDYLPSTGAQYDANLTNLTSLMFAEEQMGFLAGVLAGGMSKSGFVCSISSLKTPRSDRYIMSFRAGAVWQAGEDMKGMNNYINIQTTDSNIPNFMDPTGGKDTAQDLINAGCDVIFGVAANGALLAAKENNLMAIGFDVDQYNTYPAAQTALLSSTKKNVDVAVYNYLKTVADGSVQAGIITGTLQNGGVSLAPFHDWDSQIPVDLKARIQQASDGIKNGSITLDVP